MMPKNNHPESGHSIPIIDKWLSGIVLDNQEGAEVPSPEQYELMEIVAALGISPDLASFEALAKDLSNLAGKSPPWSPKYIHSVYHGYPGCQAGRRLRWAISALAQTIDGSPPGIAGAVYVRILASPDIPEGVLLPTNARIIKCARPGCPVKFIRTHPSQRYHHPNCRKRK